MKNTQKLTKRFSIALIMLLISVVLLSTASFAWFSMNTTVRATGFELEAYSDALYIVISKEKNGTYEESVSFESESKKVLTLVTQGVLPNGALKLNFVKGEGIWKSTDKTQYFVQAPSDITSTPSEQGMDNYIAVPESSLTPSASVAGLYKNPNFEIVLNGTYSASAGITYYEKPSSVNGSGIYNKKNLSDGDSLKGLYTVSSLTAEAAGVLYDGLSTYYSMDSDGNLKRVENLKLGTDLTQYYKLDSASKTTEYHKVADGTSKYYFAYSNAKKTGLTDYVCIGVPDLNKSLENYRYWGHAYSSVVQDGQQTNTLNIVDGEKYYYKSTVYIKSAPETNPGENLRVENVNIGGKKNQMTNAIRVLFVATAGDGKVSTVLYDYETGFENGNKKLFDMILGNEQEIVTVDIYMYFDGQDADSIDYINDLNPHTVDIEFAINDKRSK